MYFASLFKLTCFRDFILNHPPLVACPYCRSARSKLPLDHHLTVGPTKGLVYPLFMITLTDALDRTAFLSQSGIMDNLPQELVDLIVDQLYFESVDSLHWREALTRYSMSSSRLRAACLRWLFRSVSVTHDAEHRNLASFWELTESSSRLVALFRSSRYGAIPTSSYPSCNRSSLTFLGCNIYCWTT